MKPAIPVSPSASNKVLEKMMTAPTYSVGRSADFERITQILTESN